MIGVILNDHIWPKPGFYFYQAYLVWFLWHLFMHRTPLGREKLELIKQLGEQGTSGLNELKFDQFTGET